MSDLGYRLWSEEQYRAAYRVQVTPPEFGDNFDAFYPTANEAAEVIERDVEWQISCLAEAGVDPAAITVRTGSGGHRIVLVMPTALGGDVPARITYCVERFEYLAGDDPRGSLLR